MDRWDDLAIELEQPDAEALREQTQRRVLLADDCDECGERPSRCECVRSDPAARAGWTP